MPFPSLSHEADCKGVGSPSPEHNNCPFYLLNVILWTWNFFLIYFELAEKYISNVLFLGVIHALLGPQLLGYSGFTYMDLNTKEYLNQTLPSPSFHVGAELIFYQLDSCWLTEDLCYKRSSQFWVFLTHTRVLDCQSRYPTINTSLSLHPSADSFFLFNQNG